MSTLIEFWNYIASFHPMRVAAVITDFALITILIYALLYFLRGTRSANVLFGTTVLLVTASLLANLLQLTVISALLSGLLPILGVAIIIIFQPEIRRFLAEAGSMFSYSGKGSSDASQGIIDEMANAAFQMSMTRTGALIVLERNIGLEGFVKTSTRLDAKANSLLLQSIFFKNSPLHDCAVIIRGNRIVAAKAVLPLTPEDSLNMPARRFGTRHRAAIGITEETDAVALVVSEETGAVSVAYKGRLVRCTTAEELTSMLNTLLVEQQRTVMGKFKRNPKKNQPAQPDLFDTPDEAAKTGEKGDEQ